MEFGPIHAIKDDMVLSPSMPRLGIRISPDFIYLGDLQYIAREMFHIEEFIFLSPNGIGHVTRLLLVHFAGYLENKEGAYEFTPLQTVRLDGDEYQHESDLVDIHSYLNRFPGSDLAHGADYIRQRAYTLAGDMVYQRFTRLVSPDRRNKFIVAYLERNNDQSLTAEKLRQDEYARAWLSRAMDSFSIIHDDHIAG
jgi:hypothetical protein